jgi:hypothetical protein
MLPFQIQRRPFLTMTSRYCSLSCPFRFSAAHFKAQQFRQPGLTGSQPTTGFQVESQKSLSRHIVRPSVARRGYIEAGRYASAAASFGWFDLSTDRTITLPGIVDRLTSDFSAVSFGARIESGYRFPVLMSSGITPYGAVRRSAGQPQLTGEWGGADPALARRLGA